MRDGLRAMLTGGRHEVVGEAADAAAALEDVLRLRADVVLLDLGLHGSSGLELLAALRARGCTARCLVLTMSDHARDVAAAMQSGVDGYVLKDSSRADLLLAIDEVLRGQRHMDPRVAELASKAAPEDREHDRLNLLSPRERQIVTLVVRGRSSSEIATMLDLSSKTIDTYRSRLMAKLGVDEVPALVRFAIRAGLIGADDA